MTTILRPYPKYREIGHQFLGVIPSHWDALRIKRIATINPSKSESLHLLSTDQPVTFLPMEKVGTRGQIDTSNRMMLSSVWSGFTYFRRGDVIVAKITPCFENGKGACLDELPTPIGFGSTEFIVLRSSEVLLPRFLYRLTTHQEFRARGADAMTGSAGQQRVPTDFIGDFIVPLPPVSEQTCIVRYLDYIDQKVRQFVNIKRRMIDLLEEQKRTIIEMVITRGLSSNTCLKQSGVRWLGDVPAHWTVASLRFRYDQRLGKKVDAKKVTGKHLTPYLRNFDVRWDSINVQDLPLIDITPEERESFTVKVGDLLVCEGRHLGRSAFWDGQLEVCGFQMALHRLRALNPTTDNPRYLFYCLYLAHIKDGFDASSTDNSIPHLTGEMLRAQRFPFPPLEEQTAIVTHLDNKFAAIKEAVAIAQAEINHIEEFRTRLIADVVTGKLDVREAAAGHSFSAGLDGIEYDPIGSLHPNGAANLDDDSIELFSVIADED